MGGRGDKRLVGRRRWEGERGKRSIIEHSSVEDVAAGRFTKPTSFLLVLCRFEQHQTPDLGGGLREKTTAERLDFIFCFLGVNFLQNVEVISLKTKIPNK